MLVEILTIGREILDGRVLDTNSMRLAELIKPLGLTPRLGQKVDDDIERIVSAFRIASERSQIVFVTGGLGPTSDDLTAAAFARFLGETLSLNAQALAQIEAFFKNLNMPLSGIQKKQALLPPSCFVIHNKKGSAPGFGCEKNGVQWYFMPGVPQEMECMMREEILPKLPRSSSMRSMTWATQFTSEGALQEQLTPIEQKLPSGFEITYCTRFPENHIGLYGLCSSQRLSLDFDSLSLEISASLGDSVFSMSRDLEPLQSLEEVVLQLLKKQGIAIATVESCTGGLIAHRLTEVSGASGAFWGSMIAYDNSAKRRVGVPTQIIDAEGAVSSATAIAMAECGLRNFKESLSSGTHNVSAVNGLCCLSTTGIAGPGGGTPQKPVGLCYIALARTGHATIVEEVRGRPQQARSRYKLFFAQKALDLVRRSYIS